MAGGQALWTRLRQPSWRGSVAIAVLLALTLTISHLVPARRARPTPAPPTHVVTVSTNQPGEESVAPYHSTATGAQPKYLRLPSIQAEGFVQAVGVDQHHQVAVPTNIRLAGWFT